MQYVELDVVTNVGDFRDVESVILLLEVLLKLPPSFKHQELLLVLAPFILLTLHPPWHVVTSAVSAAQLRRADVLRCALIALCFSYM